MFKIDRNKWLAAVAAAEGKREELTKLYSIRSMARGKLHRKRAEFTAYEFSKLRGSDAVQAIGGSSAFTQANGTLVFDLTAEDQEKYIGLAWQEFERVPA